MKSKVAFVKVEHEKNGVQKAVKRAMNLVNWKKHVSGNKIALKINCMSSELVPGQCTSPWVLEGVLQEVLERYPNNNVIVCDADLAADKQLEKASKVWGVQDLCKKYGVDFVNLSNDETRGVNLNYKIFKNLDLPNSIIETDSIIQLPILKTHCLTTITCSLKCSWGIVNRTVRHQYHSVAHQCIADINNFLKEKIKLSVVDGTIGMEGNAPRTGITKICDVILCGNDIVSVDSAAATYMGFDPKKIKHIVISNNDGIGDINFRLIGDKFTINNFIPGVIKNQAIFKYEMMLRKSILKGLIFDTPLINLFFRIATAYNKLYYWNKHGKNFLNDILNHPFYGVEFKPLVEKNKILVK